MNLMGRRETGSCPTPGFVQRRNDSLEIIGEALNHVRREEPAIVERLPRIHEWVALRNILSHLYDRVDLEIVWDTVNDDLPPLIETLRNLIAHAANE